MKTTPGCQLVNSDSHRPINMGFDKLGKGKRGALYFQWNIRFMTSPDKFYFNKTPSRINLKLPGWSLRNVVNVEPICC